MKRTWNTSSTSNSCSTVTPYQWNQPAISNDAYDARQPSVFLAQSHLHRNVAGRPMDTGPAHGPQGSHPVPKYSVRSAISSPPAIELPHQAANGQLTSHPRCDLSIVAPRQLPTSYSNDWSRLQRTVFGLTAVHTSFHKAGQRASFT